MRLRLVEPLQIPFELAVRLAERRRDHIARTGQSPLEPSQTATARAGAKKRQRTAEMASQPQRSRSRSRDDSDADPPRRDPEREQLERDLDDLERWKETGELPPGYDSREQLERDLADLSRLNDQRELPPGYSYLPPRPPPPPRRFQRSDRVVCSLGGGFGWLPGAVQSVNEPNPQDPMEVFPYVVKLDPPLGKLISVPEDRKNFCRSEICFDGDVPGGAQFSIACLARVAIKFTRRLLDGVISTQVPPSQPDEEAPLRRRR